MNIFKEIKKKFNLIKYFLKNINKVNKDKKVIKWAPILFNNNKSNKIPYMKART